MTKIDKKETLLLLIDSIRERVRVLDVLDFEVEMEQDLQPVYGEREAVGFTVHGFSLNLRVVHPPVYSISKQTKIEETETSFSPFLTGRF